VQNQVVGRELYRPAINQIHDFINLDKKKKIQDIFKQTPCLYKKTDSCEQLWNTAVNTEPIVVLLWLEKEQSYTEQDCSNPHYPISALCIHRLLFVVLACAITFVAAMLLTYWSRLEPVIEGGRVSFSLFFLIVKLQRILKICRVI